MKELLKNLVKLQEAELGEAKAEEKLVAELRAKIPPQILGHYDRLMGRGKKGIVPVRHQTCSGCHMRLPIGAITTLMHGTDIQLCDSCGRYLYLPESAGTEILAQAASEAAQTKTRRAKAASRKAQAG